MAKHNIAIGERAKVQEFIVSLKRRANVYVFVDTDSEDRHFKSGFDFIVTGASNSVFIEAKKVKANEDLEKKLSDFQKYTRAYVLAVGGLYCSLAFRPSGDFLRFYRIEKKGGALAWTDFRDPVATVAQLAGARIQ